MFKEFKKEMVFSTIIYVIIGVILIIWPDKTAKAINYILAFALSCGGVTSILRYVKKDIVNGARSFDLTLGIVLLAIASFLFLNPTFIASILPTILGFILFVSGVIKFQNAVDVARVGYEKWWFMMLLSLISVGAGILILINPFGTAKLLTVVIGVGFVYSGLSDLLATFFINGKIKDFEKKMNERENIIAVVEEKK